MDTFDLSSRVYKWLLADNVYSCPHKHIHKSAHMRNLNAFKRLNGYEQILEKTEKIQYIVIKYAHFILIHYI